MKLLLPMIACTLISPSSFAENKTPTPDELCKQYQSKLISTLETLINLEKEESKKIAMIEKSENFKKCIEGNAKSCKTAKEDLKNRSQIFSSLFASIWGTAIAEMTELNQQIQSMPDNSHGNLEVKRLSYFIDQYKMAWTIRNQAINDEFSILLASTCEDKDPSCLVEGNADFLIQKHQLMIDMDQKAIQSLKTNSGEFVPNSMTI